MTAVNASKYQIVNGTYYDARTAAEVVRVLEQARLKQTRIRIHLGDTEGSGEPVSRAAKDLGMDWLDEFDCEGTVGRSMGPIKIPLMITNSRSMGGPGILDRFSASAFESPKQNLGTLPWASNPRFRAKSPREVRFSSVFR